MRTIILLLVLLPFVGAVNEHAPLDVEISDEDKAMFDEILQPVVKIYTFLKYIATVVAAIFLLYSGMSYMASGSDPRKREDAKNIAAYVIVGLLIIWAAPLLIGFLVS